MLTTATTTTTSFGDSNNSEYGAYNYTSIGEYRLGKVLG